MTQAIADVLDAAADLLTPEGAWTQNAPARDENGRDCPSSDPRAVCFCAGGAILRVAGWSGLSSEAIDRFRTVLPGEGIIWFNDDPKRTQAEVVAKLREAATAARQSNDMEGDGR